jgi:hypothetical protein
MIRGQWCVEVADGNDCYSRPEEMVAYLQRGRNLNLMRVSPDCLRGNIQG